MEDYGTDVTGSVITYTKQLDPCDSEYYDYNVKFQYMCNGALRIDTHSISINFMHLDYANRGELYHTPKLVTILSDLEERFQSGAPVHVTYLAFFPWIKRIEFEPHPNQLIDQKTLEAYEKTSW